MFGDRLNIALNNYENEYPVVEKLIMDESIQIIDHRVIPISLENVFIHLINESKQNNVDKFAKS